jgi:DNA-binding PadR family transcriptional regulator
VTAPNFCESDRMVRKSLLNPVLRSLFGSGYAGSGGARQLLLDRSVTTRYDTTWNVIMSDPTLLVLSSLAESDKHGYAIMEDVERFAGVRLGPGTLYGAITRLEQRRWIRPVSSTDRRQPYTLTGAGRDYLNDQLEQLDRVVKTGLKRLRHA